MPLITTPLLTGVRRIGLIDAIVLLSLGAIIYGMIEIAREWTGVLHPLAEIHLEARYLPLYMLYSLTRGLLAYLISFLFTMVYGYAAARVAGADKVLLRALDVP